MTLSEKLETLKKQVTELSKNLDNSSKEIKEIRTTIATTSEDIAINKNEIDKLKPKGNYPTKSSYLRMN